MVVECYWFYDRDLVEVVGVLVEIGLFILGINMVIGGVGYFGLSVCFDCIDDVCVVIE